MLKDFLLFPWKVQGSDPAWIPPLLLDQKALFSPKHPFHQHGSVKSWLALSPIDKKIVGRICAIVNSGHNKFHNDHVAFFGFFDCINDAEVSAELLETAESDLRSKGFDTIRGPMNFSTNEECGMLIEGFDTPPAVMMTHNPPYYNTLMEQCGYVKARDLLAFCMTKENISDRILAIGEKLESRLSIRFRMFDMKDFWAEVERFKTVYNQAWEDNWGFVPMTDAEINTMAKNLKMVMDPRLVFFAEDEAGKPVGFILGLPDLNVLIKKIDGRLFPFGIITLLTGLKKLTRARILAMGVLPAYRKRGIDTVMYYRAFKAGVDAGYNWGEFSWVLDDNKLMIDAANSLGAHAYKRWRIWEKPL